MLIQRRPILTHPLLRVLGLALGILSIAAVAPPPANLPVLRQSIDLIPARSREGRTLGTLVLPSIMEAAQAGNPDRPLVVVFNGGPGAASAWLQLGLLGSRRITLPDDPARPIPATLALEPNPEGLWRDADILFVDPLGTGFSRVAPGVDPAEVRDWRRDGDYVAAAVREWMRRHDRSDAPLILLGESYGAERAVAVADTLSRTPGLRLAGMVLLSQTVTNETGLMHRDRNLATAIGFPTIAASACYHRTSKLGLSDPAQCAARSVAFVRERYLPALRAGSTLSGAQRSATVLELARFSGLPASHFEAGGLTLPRHAYRVDALAAQGMVLGMYDSRFVAGLAPGRAWRDPSLDPVLPPMQRAAERHARETLKLARSPVDGSRYILFDPAIHADWRYGADRDPYGSIDMPAMLSASLKRSGARLLLAGGMFDTVGAYGADLHLAEQLALPPGRVAVHSYPAGHMFYLDARSRSAFLPVLRTFVRSAAGRTDAVS